MFSGRTDNRHAKAPKQNHFLFPYGTGCVTAVSNRSPLSPEVIRDMKQKTPIVLLNQTQPTVNSHTDTEGRAGRTTQPQMTPNSGVEPPELCRSLWVGRQPAQMPPSLTPSHSEGEGVTGMQLRAAHCRYPSTAVPRVENHLSLFLGS